MGFNELNSQHANTTDTRYKRDYLYSVSKEGSGKISEDQLPLNISRTALHDVSLNYVVTHDDRNSIRRGGDDYNGGAPAWLLPLAPKGGPGAVELDLIPIVA
jgi:hypothetical protein